MMIEATPLETFLIRVGDAIDQGKRVIVGDLFTLDRKDGTDLVVGKSLRGWISGESPAPSEFPQSEFTVGLNPAVLLSELLSILEPIRVSSSNTAVKTAGARFWSECFGAYESRNPRTGEAFLAKPAKVLYARIGKLTIE